MVPIKKKTKERHTTIILMELCLPNWRIYAQITHEFVHFVFRCVCFSLSLHFNHSISKCLFITFYWMSSYHDKPLQSKYRHSLTHTHQHVHSHFGQGNQHTRMHKKKRKGKITITNWLMQSATHINRHFPYERSKYACIRCMVEWVRKKWFHSRYVFI